MTEGWLNFDYVVLFSENERLARSLDYKIAKYLPGFTLVGLYDWDYFLVTDSDGIMYSVPSVPLHVNSVHKFSLPENMTLEVDERYVGKVKWYLKPTIIGGNPLDAKNLAWVSQKLHADLVGWWNEKYKQLIARQPMGATTSAMSSKANESGIFDGYNFSKADSLAA